MSTLHQPDPSRKLTDTDALAVVDELAHLGDELATSALALATLGCRAVARTARTPADDHLEVIGAMVRLELRLREARRVVDAALGAGDVDVDVVNDEARELEAIANELTVARLAVEDLGVRATAGRFDYAALVGTLERIEERLRATIFPSREAAARARGLQRLVEDVEELEPARADEVRAFASERASEVVLPADANEEHPRAWHAHFAHVFGAGARIMASLADDAERSRTKHEASSLLRSEAEGAS
jgi:hypothetical protein